MHVFVAGATEWVVAAAVDDLLGHGHQALGLARSAEKVLSFTAKSVKVLQATLDDLDALRAVVAASDAAVRLGFNHDASRFVENAAQDRRAIAALGGRLESAEKPLLVRSSVAMIAPGRMATEADLPSSDPSMPCQSDQAEEAGVPRPARGHRPAVALGPRHRRAARLQAYAHVGCSARLPPDHGDWSGAA